MGAEGPALRILIVRTSALGDVVHALPVLTALRRHLPEAKIGWVVEEGMAPVLAGHPDLDELLVVRLRQWRKRLRPVAPASWAASSRALRRFSADVALDLMGNHKAGVLAPPLGRAAADRLRPQSSGASRRAPSGSTGRWRRAATHAVDRMLSLLDALGLPPEPADFGPEKLFREEPAAARDLFAAHPEPFALLHPGRRLGQQALSAGLVGTGGAAAPGGRPACRPGWRRRAARRSWPPRSAAASDGRGARRAGGRPADASRR